MRQAIIKSVRESVEAVQKLQHAHALDFIEMATHNIVTRIQQGNKILIAGNGGSLSDATHFAEELTGFFRNKRPALPAIALAEPGHITCTANDIGFDYIFSRGIEALGKPGDVFIGLTTSGNSPNMIHAFKKAKEMGLYTIAFLGKSGGKLKGFADLELIIDGFTTSDRIQEAHMTAMHIIVEMMENLLFQPEEACAQVYQNVPVHVTS